MTPDESNLENNVLAILSFASTRSTWVSIASCTEKTGVSYDSVRQYMMIDEFVNVAACYHYDYRIRWRPSRGGFTADIWVVNRGYATYDESDSSVPLALSRIRIAKDILDS